MLELLAALGAAVLEPDLYSRLGQVDLEGDLLAHEDVRIARLAEEGLQDVQLGTGECGAFSSLLPWVDSPHTLREPYGIEPVG